MPGDHLRGDTVECEEQHVTEGGEGQVRLQAGHYFHYSVAGDLVAELPGGAYRATPGTLLFFPSGLIYQVRAAARTARIITLRLRSRGWATTTPGDQDAWETLLALTKFVYIHGPCLPLAPETGSMVAGALAGMVAESSMSQPGRSAMLKAQAMALLVVFRRDPAMGEALAGLAGADGYQRIREALWEINECFHEPLRLEGVARNASLSRTTFQALLKQVTGMTFSQYLAQVRIRKACQLLAETNEAIVDIANACGYRSISQFYAAFRQVTGAAPQQYRRTQ